MIYSDKMLFSSWNLILEPYVKCRNILLFNLAERTEEREELEMNKRNGYVREREREREGSNEPKYSLF
jgi:hypothetical protein